MRRLVQQEDYALRLMHGAGVRSPEPFGIVEITPEREYLVVTEFFDDAQEIGDLDQVDDGIIDDGLRIIRHLWDAGLAHRDIKPANLLVRDGRLYLIDVFFAEVRPSPWRQAVDLANMMLVLATRSSCGEQVYRRARLQFNDDEIAEAFAATSGITMPSQLRKTMRDQGRDLHADFLRLLPERPPPIAIQRWSIRRVGLMIGVALLALLALLTALSSFGAAGLLRRSLPLALACLVLAGCAVGPQAGSRFLEGHEPTCTYQGRQGTALVVLMAQAVPTASQLPASS